MLLPVSKGKLGLVVLLFPESEKSEVANLSCGFLISFPVNARVLLLPALPVAVLYGPV